MSKIFERQQKARKALDDIWKKPEHVNVIHYSCESFYDRPEGKSPHIVSISIKNLGSGQLLSYSIHKIAEEKGIDSPQIPNYYNDLEREMLARYFKKLKEEKNFTWVHWNMKDDNYGFFALESRYRVLKGKPFVLPDSNKFDLSSKLIEIYGTNYIKHPRLEKLIEKNKISMHNFKTGKQEAQLYSEGKYNALHLSTASKADKIFAICRDAYESSLKTNTRFWDIHANGLKSVVYKIQNHPVIWLSITFIAIASAIYSFVNC